MFNNFHLDEFVAKFVIKRPVSLFANDMQANREALQAAIEGASMLVIGAAGTIGSNFVKAALPFKPAKLVVVDINENGLTEFVRDCRSESGFLLPSDFKSYPINFSDKVFNKIFANEGPFDIVANFAAHKHVRSEKDIFSIEAMIENNVINAKSLLDLLVQHPPRHFFCVSTDKAANPVNIMGASKKLMEEMIMAYSRDLKITTARFANVAFSNGSLLAGFIERVAKRQPLSCPADVKRFFVSPKESGEICLLSCILGETGDIFFPRLSPEEDLTSFASIIDPFLQQFGCQIILCKTEEEARLATPLIAENKYPVYLFNSETSGEKLFEEFYTEKEKPLWDKYASLGVIKNRERQSRAEIDAVVSEIEQLFARDANKQNVVTLLTSLLPGFKHIETGLNLDQKM
ncbi:Polysaccharide biosynthesis protein [Filimonas lacunae]|uniref:Polysaccharide biosynthesis protein n=1 Tax=Filimonas lacunae TaxID=477680 RepID=A0A173MS71_9BACT|nr:polysaccharide biosynthesis protein [Filimonas lacunae]BAV10208.1 UDP-N-acetylglucosamine 4,6-dehydratase [Filimonas lacunae]SIT18245.1 Polysaccharide biosynthesis protein [Filimonas lacunae]